MTLSRFAPSATPRAPNTTSSTASPSVTHSRTPSHCAASSAGDAAAVAPASSAGCSFTAFRPHTTTRCPAPINRSAIGKPMSPNPIQPNVAIGSGFVREVLTSPSGTTLSYAAVLTSPLGRPRIGST